MAHDNGANGSSNPTLLEGQNVSLWEGGLGGSVGVWGAAADAEACSEGSVDGWDQAADAGLR